MAMEQHPVSGHTR